MISLCFSSILLPIYGTPPFEQLLVSNFLFFRSSNVKLLQRHLIIILILFSLFGKFFRSFSRTLHNLKIRNFVFYLIIRSYSIILSIIILRCTPECHLHKHKIKFTNLFKCNSGSLKDQALIVYHQG